MPLAELFTQADSYVMLATLAALEIVLGIDNIVFITILCGRLPPAQQPLARRLGLGLALISRLGLLFALGWIMRLQTPLFHILGRGISGRDLILLIGGLFLLGKSTHEIYHDVEHPAEGKEEHGGPPAVQASFGLIMVQVMFLDLVFSLDSVITAVGMVPHVAIMAAAMIIAVVVMIAFAGPVGDFVQRHASVRILALSFLVLIGVLLIAESLGHHLPRGYIYFAMGFSLVIELVNMRRRARAKRLWMVNRQQLKDARGSASTAELSSPKAGPR